MTEMRHHLEKLLGYLEQDPENWALLGDASDLSLQLGDWSAAAVLVERALRLQPQDAVMRYRLAVSLRARSQIAQSLAITQALLDEGQHHPAVLFEHASNLVSAQRFEDSEALLARLVSSRDTSVDLPQCAVLYLQTLHWSGKVAEAIGFALGHLLTFPDDARVKGMLSLLYLDNNELAEAEKYSTQSLSQDPKNLHALITAGYVALAVEQLDDAQAAFDEVLAQSGDSGRGWMGLGLMYLMQFDLPKAHHAFEKTIAQIPTHLGSHNTLAWIQMLQKNPAAARKTLESALAIDRNFGETYGGLAVLATQENDWEAARHYRDLALRLQPDSFAGRFAQSLILSHRGHPVQAEAMIDAILANFKVAGGGTLKDMSRRFLDRHQQNQS